MLHEVATIGTFSFKRSLYGKLLRIDAHIGTIKVDFVELFCEEPDLEFLELHSEIVLKEILTGLVFKLSGGLDLFDDIVN